MSKERAFLKYCLNHLDLKRPDEFDTYFASVPLCAFNAVYSINTRYEAVLNALKRFCDHFGLPMFYPVKGEIPPIECQKSVSDVYDLVSQIRRETLAQAVFKNRQRTSPSNGILKADACVRFLSVLRQFNVQYYQDIACVIADERFDEQIKRIPGQRSGISLKYFFMLAGSKDLIKPDRMVLGFIEDATGENLKEGAALDLIQSTVMKLNNLGYKNLSPRHLDNLIWNYQRDR